MSPVPQTRMLDGSLRGGVSWLGSVILMGFPAAVPGASFGVVLTDVLAGGKALGDVRVSGERAKRYIDQMIRPTATMNKAMAKTTLPGRATVACPTGASRSLCGRYRSR